jgi:hypothetical protein
VYHGARGRYHYFLCLQFILRKQIAALIKLWDLPAEFEARVRQQGKIALLIDVLDPLQRLVDFAFDYAAKARSR